MCSAEIAYRLIVLVLAACGGLSTPEAVLRPDLIRDVYDVWSEVSTHTLTGKLTITFFPEKVGHRLNGNSRS